MVLIFLKRFKIVNGLNSLIFLGAELDSQICVSRLAAGDILLNLAFYFPVFSAARYQTSKKAKGLLHTLHLCLYILAKLIGLHQLPTETIQ